MRIGERAAHLVGTIQSFRKRELDAAIHQRTKIFAGKIFHYDVWLTVRFADIVDNSDIIVGKSSGSSCFAIEPLLDFRVFKGQFRNDLDRNLPINHGVISAIDHSHSASAQLFADFVFADFLQANTERVGDFKKLVFKKPERESNTEQNSMQLMAEKKSYWC